MSRKNRVRSKSRSSRRRRSTRSTPTSPPSSQREEQLPSASEKVVAKAPVGRAAPVDFKAEYHYVYSDLKRIGVLAAIMFAVLIAMALAVRL